MGNNSIEQERKKKKNASKNTSSVQGNPKLNQPDRPGT